MQSGFDLPITRLSCRSVVPGVPGVHTQILAVNPISTRGADYSQLTTTGISGFSDLLTALC